MEGDQPACLNCHHLRGCPIIDRDGELDESRMIVAGQECSSWTEAGETEEMIRQNLIRSCGMAAIRAIHSLKAKEDQVTQEESDDMSESIDLASIARPNMSRQEREEQLLYETEDDGSIKVDETGEKIPRRALYLKRYAVNQLGLQNDQATFWNVKKLVQQIMKTEAESGMIADKKAMKQAQRAEEEPMENKGNVTVVKRVIKPSGMVSAPKPTVAQPAQQEQAPTSVPPKMAGKVVRPITNKAVERPAQSAPVTRAPEAPAFDMKALEDLISKAVAGAVKEIKQYVDAKQDETVQLMTAMHDAIIYRVQRNHTIVDAGEGQFQQFVVEDPGEGLLGEQGADLRSYLGDGSGNG
jgi:hypothetical protein